MQLYYYYDTEADVLYISKGKPSPRALTRETDDVISRIDPRSKKVVGFTILNFLKRLKKSHRAVSLSIEAELVPAR